MDVKDIPLQDRELLTVKEAAAHFNIGMNRIRGITNDEGCKFVLWVGNKRMIKRELFKAYLEESYSI